MEIMHPITRQILTFLLGAATLHGFFLAVLIYAKGKRNPANKWLVLTLIALSFYLLNYLLFLTEIIRTVPHLLNIFYTAIFIIGPAFYFFMSEQINGAKTKWTIIHCLHLIPLLYYLWNSFAIFSRSATQKTAIIEQILQPAGHFTWWDVISGNYGMYLLLGYILATYLLSKKSTSDSNTSINSISNLKKLCLALVVLITLDLFLKFFSFALATPIFATEYLMAVILAIIIHFIGYTAIDVTSVQPTATIATEKYQTSALDTAQIKLYQKQLIELLEKDKIWMRTNLKIADLAQALSMPTHQLSQVLSEGLSTNFFDLINHYRIEEVKRRLVQPQYQHYSILAIALDCGFNNKATFNRVFKKMTGMTPSTFIGKVSAS